jgi:hypothetical protein
MIRAVPTACPCIKQGHVYGRLTRCRVVDHGVVHSATCMA